MAAEVLDAAGRPTTTDPFAGLVSRKKKKETTMPPVNPAEPDPFEDRLQTGAGPGDEADDDEAEEEEEAEPLAAQAPPAASATTPAPPRKRHRNRKSPLSGVTRFNAEQAHAPGPTQYPEGINPQDPLIKWPEILEQIKALGQSPDYVTIRIMRTGMGPYPSEPAQVANIEGSLVMGGETQSAGQALVDYITDWVHAGRKGPAKYTITVFQKQGRGSFPQMVLRLEDPEEILAQKRRHEAFIQSQRMAGALRPVAGPVMQANPQYGYPPPMFAAPPAPPPQPFQAPADPIAEWARYEQFRQTLIANGQPAPPAAPAPAPPPPPPPPPPVVVHQPRLTPEEEELLEEAKFRRMAERLGYKQVGVGAPVPVTPSAAAQAAADPVDAMNNLISTYERMVGMGSRVRKAFGIVEAPAAIEPDEPAEAPEPEKKITYFKIPGKPFGHDFQVSTSGATFIDQVKETILGNPEVMSAMSMRMMKGAAEILDKSSFATLVAKLATGGGAPAQLAAATQTAGLVGVGAMNGAAPIPQVAARPRGPLA